MGCPECQRPLSHLLLTQFEELQKRLDGQTSFEDAAAYAAGVTQRLVKCYEALSQKRDSMIDSQLCGIAHPDVVATSQAVDAMLRLIRLAEDPRQLTPTCSSTVSKLPRGPCLFENVEAQTRATTRA